MYEPNDTDLSWMAGLLEMTTEGAIMVYPSSGLIYKISHVNKTLTLQNPARLADRECKRLHETTTVVAAFFMYEMKEATQ